MDSQYAILTLKRTNKDFYPDEIIDWDICEDCYKKIDLVVRDKKAMIITEKNLGNWLTTKGSYLPNKSSDIPPSLRGTYVTWTGNDPINKESGTWKTDFLNKHLDVTCV